MVKCPACEDKPPQSLKCELCFGTGWTLNRNADIWINRNKLSKKHILAFYNTVSTIMRMHSKLNYMTAKQQLEQEKDDYKAQILKHESMITDSTLKIKFLKKRIKLVDDELSELPEEHANQPEKPTVAEES